jgi:hypothetical protein
VTTPVAALACDAEPDVFEAVTITSNVTPTSAACTVYELPVAPVILEHPNKHRCH